MDDIVWFSPPGIALRESGPGPGPITKALATYERDPECRVCGQPGEPDPGQHADLNRRIDLELLCGKSCFEVFHEVEPLVADWPLRRRPGPFAISLHADGHLHPAEVVRAINGTTADGLE